MDTVEDLITDKAIDIAWGNANFGENTCKRNVIANTLLKCACGYSSGSTANHIVSELGLAKDRKLTRLGKEYLFVAYSKGISV